MTHEEFLAEYLLLRAQICELEQENAPRKQMFVMKDATHGLLESSSKEFSGYVHQIANL